jgi:hypothetical protein
LFGSPCRQIKHRAPVFNGGLNVEEHKFIRARDVIGDGLFNGISRVDEINEVDAFDGAPFGDIEAGDDAGFEHVI